MASHLRLDSSYCAAGHVRGEFASPITCCTIIQNRYHSMGTSWHLCTSLRAIYWHRSHYGKGLLSMHGKDIHICNHNVYALLYLCQFHTENITVVDPTIRLTWIKANWSNDEVIRVKGRIIDLVRLVLLIVSHSNIHPRWMHAERWAMKPRLLNRFCHRASHLAHVTPAGKALPRNTAFQHYAHNEHHPEHRQLNKNLCCI